MSHITDSSMIDALEREGGFLDPVLREGGTEYGGALNDLASTSRAYHYRGVDMPPSAVDALIQETNAWKLPVTQPEHVVVPDYAPPVQIDTTGGESLRESPASPSNATGKLPTDAKVNTETAASAPAPHPKPHGETGKPPGDTVAPAAPTSPGDGGAPQPKSSKSTTRDVVDDVVSRSRKASGPSKRKLYQVFTHDAEGMFSVGRATISTAILAVVAFTTAIAMRNNARAKAESGDITRN